MSFKKGKKLLSGMLAAALLLTSLPAYSSASEDKEQGRKKFLSDIDAEDNGSAIGGQASELIESIRNASESETGQGGRKADNARKLSIKKSSNLYKQDSLPVQGNIDGKCGENVSFNLDTATGKMIISGNGAMADYEYATDSPFYKYGEIITSVEVAEGVTSIGRLSFAFCFGIERVYLPSTLTAIAQQAFLGCISLDAIVVPESVASVGDYALGFCCNNGKEGGYEKTGLNIIGKTGSYVETYASTNGVTFAANDKFTYSCGENASWEVDLKTGVLKITGSGAMSDYSFKAYNGEKPEYYPYRFYIDSVVIGAGITTVGAEAFYNFPNLKKAEIADSVASIKASAFYGCGSLTDILLPEKLTSIEVSAFAYCYGIKSISIPSGVSNIDTSAFLACSGLEKIEVSADNEKYSSYQGVLFNKNKTTLIKFPTCSKLVSFTVPESVTTVTAGAFTGGNTLKSLLFEGDAPASFYDSSQEIGGLRIYYDSSKKDWVKRVNEIEDADVMMIDMSELLEKDSLSIKAGSSQFKVGESMKLNPEISPYLAAQFLWSSSNEEVAVVSDMGKVLAVNPGTAEIQAKSSDGKYSASVTLTVTGTVFSTPDYMLETLTDGIKFTSINTPTKQIVSEKLHGIYFLEGKNLGFYSLLDKSYKTVQNFKGCKDVYVADEKLYVLYSNVCYVYDLSLQEVVSKIEINGCSPSAVGADAQGRVYVSGYSKYNTVKNVIMMFSKNGEKLSELPVGTYVYAFSGFDNTNGNFYMESFYDYYSWGYSHPGKGLTMGKVSGDKLMSVDTYYGFTESGIISRSMGCLLYLCQDVYMKHQTCAELLGGRYLAAASVLHGAVKIYDSNSASDTGISEVMSISRSAAEEGDDDTSDYYDLSSIGVRTVYNERNNSIFIYENNKMISEYSLDTGKKLSNTTTQHKVFNLLKMGDSLVAIEKENNVYYMEILDVSAPEQIKIQAESTQMKVGDYQQLSMESGKKYNLSCDWSSGDSSVVSVTKEGKVSAWKEGEAVITAKVSEKLSDKITIKVTASDVVAPKENIIKKDGQKSNNVSANNYTVWADTVKSHLVENDDKTLTRVEYIKDKGVIVENYSKDYEFIDSKVVPVELSYFGGFYSGKNANFIVFGQNNEAESDETEVIRIVKYGKDWERKGQCSVKGANTYIPFDAGSLRMAENENMLYIYTCHEMYVSDDSYHHQSNMTFVLNEDTMEVSQSYYDVMNIAQAGYVSHSFNQFIKTDGKYIFRVDHGDANPRAVSLTRCDTDGKITDVSYTLPFSINGYSGANATGVSVGGFELSSDNCLIAGNSVDMSDKNAYSANGKRNIFLTVTDKELAANNTVWLTEYKSDSDITVYTPSLVKLNQEQFLVMWEEYNSKSKKTKLKMVTVDSYGNKTSEIVEAGLRLSDCAPIMSSDGLVKWYVTDSSNVNFCVINPYDLSSVNGDISGVSSDDNGDNTSPTPTGSGSEGNASPSPTGSGNTVPSSPKPAGGSDGSSSSKKLLPQGKTVTDKKTKTVYVVTKRGKTVSIKKTSNKKITKAVIPSTVTLSGVKYKVTGIAANAYSGCSKLKTVTIGANVTSIGDKAFYKCKKLTKISIPSKVSKIGKKAFYGCSKLKTVTIKTSKLTNKSVGANAFKGINAKAQIKVPKKKKAAYKKMLRAKGVGKKAKIK